MDFLFKDNEIGTLILKKNWTDTDLDSWRACEKEFFNLARLCLKMPTPSGLVWGENYRVFYNEAYSSYIQANKHPLAFGQPMREVWPEHWEGFIKPMLDEVIATQNAIKTDNLRVFINRHIPREEIYVIFSISPVIIENEVKGFFTTHVEVTEQWFITRQQETLRDLTLVGTKASTAIEACKNSGLVLAANRYDIPFAAIYFSEKSTTEVTLQALSNLNENEFFPKIISLEEENSLWPLKSVLGSKIKKEIDLLEAGVQIYAEPWPECLEKALVLPISLDSNSNVGYLIVGFSTRRVINDEYYSFFDRVAVHIGVAISHAVSHEKEQRRTEELMKLDEAKTVFFNNVSHEFRTPLTLILGPLEKILADFPYSSQDNIYSELKVIQRNALRLQKLVNTLLDFSRIEAKRSIPKWELTHFSSFIQDLASVFRSIIEQSGLEFKICCNPLPQAIYIDREMWEKIIFNLLSNAFKFTFSGTIELEVTCIEKKIQVFVRDTGIGIDELNIPNLFQRFHRVEHIRSRTSEGSGIGLALVKELVELHSGEIQVKSQLGKGTAFIISFPLHIDSIPKLLPTLATTHHSIYDPAFLSEINQWVPYEEKNSFPYIMKEVSSSSARILIADDNEDIRYYLIQLLEKRWLVESVNNGKSALNLLREKKFDLVLTDVMMPVLNGYELLQEIRKDPALQDLSVIMLTAQASMGARIKGFEKGVDDYLIKPFSALEVLARVDAHLKLAARHQVFSENEILRQKNIQVEKNNHAKDLLLGTISHELRTPLTAILFSVQRMLKTNSHPLLKIIEENALTQNQLIDTLLDTSSIILGKISIEKKELELIDSMKKIIDSVIPAASEKFISLEFKEPTSKIMVFLDLLRLRQIFWNLLMNAIKFTPAKGKISINILEDHNEVQISIEDNGKGISPEFIPFLFDRFSQEDMSYSRDKGGLGIGLSLTRDLIVLQGGEINGESLGLNKGATFTVTFPKVNEFTRQCP